MLDKGYLEMLSMLLHGVLAQSYLSIQSSCHKAGQTLYIYTWLTKC